MIKIGICDDNAKIVSKIKRYVESYDKEKADIRTFKNGEELLAEEEVFDAIFLDIDMDGINGIETAQKIRIYDKDVKIIYITNVFLGTHHTIVFDMSLKDILGSLIYCSKDSYISLKDCPIKSCSFNIFSFNSCSVIFFNTSYI